MMSVELAVAGMFMAAAVICGVLASVPEDYDVRGTARRAGVVYAVIAAVWGVIAAVLS